MGMYLNPGSELFRRACQSPIYVDKSELISCTNALLNTQNCFLCVSRARRFGKTMAANMLVAYYGKGYDAHKLFDDLAIAQDPSYEQHINKYNVIFINTKSFWLRAKTAEALTSLITRRIIGELKQAYPELFFSNPDDLPWTLYDIYQSTGEQFIFIIDEWDCLVREDPQNRELSRAYLHFLEDLFKDKPYVALAYITGILPVKKYGSQSALNMFQEFTMMSSDELAPFVGFTEDEVKSLCARYQMAFEETQRWYDGYLINGLHIYNPQAIVMAMVKRHFRSYWTKTETFESLQAWIASDYEGLRRDVIAMLSGDFCQVNVSKFGNSFSDIHSRDDVLALLVHIGYLGYIEETRQVYIPNLEIAAEFATAIEANNWDEVVKALALSEDLLKAAWALDGEQVAGYLDQTYFENSVLTYHNENSLAHRLSIAFYTARQYYTVVREMPAGKGFADVVYLPRPNMQDKPALVVELKWDKDTDCAISQIKRQEYPRSLQAYKGNMLLIAVNYDKATKKHSCVIESLSK